MFCTQDASQVGARIRIFSNQSPMHARHPLTPRSWAMHFVHLLPASRASSNVACSGSAFLRSFKVSGFASVFAFALVARSVEARILWMNSLARSMKGFSAIFSSRPSPRSSRKPRSTQLLAQIPQLQPSSWKHLLLGAGSSYSWPTKPRFSRIALAARLEVSGGSGRESRSAVGRSAGGEGL